MANPTSPTSNRPRLNDNAENRNDNDNASFSYFVKTVSLKEWWLIKSADDFDGKRLAIAGFTSADLRQPRRVFSSAPITKRHDVFTLETADGITVLVHGFINRNRTVENGFSSEVLNHFLFGFPPCWEEIGKNCMEQVDNPNTDLENTSDLDKMNVDSAVLGSKDCSSVLTPSHKNGISHDDHNKVREDCSQSVSEKLNVDAPKCANPENHAAAVRSSAEDESNVNKCSSSLNNNLETMVEPTVCGTNTVDWFSEESNVSFLTSPKNCDADNVKKDSSKKFPQLSTGHITSVDSILDHIAVEAEPSNCHSVLALAEEPVEFCNTKNAEKKKRKSNNNGISHDDHNKVREDCSQSVSERFNADASKCANLENHAADVRSCAEDESNVNNCLTSPTKDLENMTEPLTQRTECNLSFFTSPKNCDAVNVKNDSSKKFPQQSTGHTTSVDSMLDQMAVQAEHSSCHVALALPAEPVEKSNRKNAGKRKRNESSSLKSMANKYEEYSATKDSSLNNCSASKFDQTVAIGNSDVTLIVFSNKSKSSNKKQKEIEGKKDVLLSRTTNFSTAATLQGPNTELRHHDEKGGNDVPPFGTPSFGDTNNQSVNNFEDSIIFPTKNPSAEVNVSSPSTVKTDLVIVSSSNSERRRSARLLRNMKDNKKQTQASGCSAKHKSKKLKSEAAPAVDRGKLKSSSCTNPHSQGKVDISEAMMRAASRLRSLEGNLEGKGQNEQIPMYKGGSSKKKTRRKITFETNLSPLSNNERKKHTDTASTQHLESLSRTPTKIFHAKVTRFMDGRNEKTCMHSAESLSLKRSRSGRLLLPMLDFWRNQIPVYDEDRNLTGIQEEIIAMSPHRGSKSEPPKKRKRRP